MQCFYHFVFLVEMIIFRGKCDYSDDLKKNWIVDIYCKYWDIFHFLKYFMLGFGWIKVIVFSLTIYLFCVIETICNIQWYFNCTNCFIIAHLRKDLFWRMAYCQCFLCNNLGSVYITFTSWEWSQAKLY